jgi:RNA polymerase sigma-70 factor, ECF subfamily
MTQEIMFRDEGVLSGIRASFRGLNQTSAGLVWLASSRSGSLSAFQGDRMKNRQTPFVTEGRLSDRDDLNSAEDSDAASDAILVQAAKDGSLDAFNILYERYLPMVYNRVRFTVPEADVEDVTQEIFIGVIRSLKSFKGDARFSTWLRTLVNRRVADYYRSRNPSETELETDISEADAVLTGLHVSANTSAIDDQIMLRRAMSELPEAYKDILLLRFVEGLQFNEIAVERRQSLEATKSLFRRAVAALRKQVEHPNA